MKRTAGCVLLAAVLWMTQTVAAKSAALTAQPHVDYPGGVVNLTGVVYQSLPGYRPTQLELYVPQRMSEPKPAVLWLHGGGWMVGDPRAVGLLSPAYPDWPALLAQLASRGYVVAAVSYRFSSEARFPAAIQDVKAAVRWLRLNAATYGIDPQRIFVWGASAGGHLAALLGTSCGVAGLEPPTDHPEVSSCVQAVVDWFGPTDFSQMDAQAALPHDANQSSQQMAAPDSGLARNDDSRRLHDAPGSAESQLLGCALPECAAGRVRSANPLTYVSARTPPFLIMHGTADDAVPIEQSRILNAALQGQGVSAELVEVPRVGHMFNGATEAQARSIIGTVFNFFERRSKPVTSGR